MGDTGNSWEAQFALIDITADTTKYYVVVALSTSTAGSGLNILDLPLEQGKYKPLNAHLLKTLGFSDSEHADQLLSPNGPLVKADHRN